MKINMLCLLCALILGAGSALRGQEKASQRRMDKLKSAVQLSRLMEMPEVNFARIRSAFLSGRDDAYEAVRDSLSAIPTAQSDERKAACRYLAAMCNRAEALFKSRERRNGDLFRELPAKSLPNLLEAYSLCPTPKSNLQRQVRREINVLLQDNEGMALIGEELRQRLIKEYVHSQLRPLDSEGYDTIVPAFRNLGITDELAARCQTAASDIDNSETLFDTMRLALKLKGAEHALPFAEELTRRLAPGQMRNKLRPTMEVYIEASPSRTLERFGDEFADNPLLGEYLYVASCRTGASGGNDGRIEKWLHPFLTAKAKEIDKDESNLSHTAYDLSSLAGKLMAINDFDGALHVCEFATALKSIDMVPIQSHLVFQKAVCLEKLGRIQEAKRAYLKCTQPKFDKFAHVDEARKKLDDLGDKK